MYGHPMDCAYFVSDLHISDPGDERALVFLNFLRALSKEATRVPGQNLSPIPTRLYLVGDIFDLWVGSHSYFVEKYRLIVDAVRELVNNGVEVHFFEGNHDLYLKPFWEDHLGVIVHSGPIIETIAGIQVRIEHGDLMNQNDRGYLFLYSLLRSRWIEKTILNLPSTLVRQVGERASRASRKYTSTSKSIPVEGIKKMIHQYAREKFKLEAFDLFISGHVHVQEDSYMQMDDNNFRVVNLGSWFDSPRAFVLTESAAHFIQLTEGFESCTD